MSIGDDLIVLEPVCVIGCSSVLKFNIKERNSSRATALPHFGLDSFLICSKIFVLIKLRRAIYAVLSGKQESLIAFCELRRNAGVIDVQALVAGVLVKNAESPLPI